MFIICPVVRGLLASRNFVITKGFLYSPFVDFYNLNPSLEHEKEKKKCITEKKLESFFGSLHTCIFTREYPYTSIAAQNNDVLLTLPRHNHIYSYVAQKLIINGQ